MCSKMALVFVGVVGVGVGVEEFTYLQEMRNEYFVSPSLSGLEMEILVKVNPCRNQYYKHTYICLHRNTSFSSSTITQSSTKSSLQYKPISMVRQKNRWLLVQFEFEGDIKSSCTI